jgi:hypothetical protein
MLRKVQPVLRQIAITNCVADEGTLHLRPPLRQLYRIIYHFLAQEAKHRFSLQTNTFPGQNWLKTSLVTTLQM